MTSMITNEARSLIGRRGPKLTARHPLGADELRRFVQGAMIEDPVHWDPVEAARRGYPAPVAPPLFPLNALRRGPGSADPLARLQEEPDWDGTDVSAGLNGLPLIDLPLKRVLNGGVEAEFRQLAVIGDVISAQARYTDIHEREGRSGPMVLITVETEYMNQDDELLVVSRHTVILR